MWWYIPIIPALGRQRQEELEFETSLGYRARPHLLHTHKKEAGDIAQK
jgi:hypothetical protein